MNSAHIAHAIRGVVARPSAAFVASIVITNPQDDDERQRYFAWQTYDMMMGSVENEVRLDVLHKYAARAHVNESVVR